ncbi:MAG: hypothetical protein DMF79_08535 [Acidobacteria bacterium]|nr:MAG: hypothetical protein DMF79_08535 [Acidobacteriota bacterium]
MIELSPWLLIALGGGAGLVGALLGLGGGIFLVPLLTLALGVPIRAAIAASLISVIATASASSTVNLDRGLVNLRLGMVLEVATSMGGLAGGITAALLAPRHLFLLFGLTLAGMGVIMARRSGRRNVIADTGVDPGRLGGRILEGETPYVYRVRRLTLALGVPIRAAIAASLISVIATASASSTVNLDRGLVNLRLGMVLEVATSMGGLAGGITAALLAPRHLFLLFGLTLAGMGVIMARRSGRRNVIADTGVDPGRLGGRILEGETPYVYRVRRLPLALGASLVAGAISGLLGLGGGIIKVPVLNAFCGIPIRVAAATSAFMIGVTAAASSFLYFGRGDVAFPLSAAIALGALPGSLLGARLTHRVQARSLKVIMAAVLLIVGAQMALKAL